MHLALSGLFKWLKERRLISKHPLADLTSPKLPRARERVLSDVELKKFWKGTEQIAEPFSSALRLMLLTGQRRREVSEMRYSELSEDLSVWTLPPERTKNKRAHQVPLSPAARDILRNLQSPSSEFVFSTTARSPISGWSKTKNRLDALMNVPTWRVHDLRRTAVTGMARAGADLAVIERAVNHVSGSFGGIVGVYQKHKYEDEVRDALEAWSNLLLSIVEDAPANVVAMRGRT
jgi:integrase